MGDDEYFRETTRRESVSLRALSFSLSLSKVVRQNRALKMWWCFLLKKKRQTKFFQRQKKMSRVLFFCIFCCSPHNHIILYVLATHREQYEWNRRTKQKNETRVRTMKKSIYFVRVRVCVQKQCCTTLFTNEEFFFAGFLVSRECRSLVKFDIIRISPRGERARFAPNSKRNLRNVLDPVKRFFPRRWRLW